MLILISSTCALSRNFFFSKVTPPEGNSFVHVTGMIQDKKGFMWLSTKNGLFRYDGTRMLPFTHDPADSNSLATNQLEAITIDNDGIIWLGTQGAGLERLDPATGIFSHFRHIPGNAQSIGNDWVTSVLADKRGMLWVGTADGLCNLDIRSGRFKHFPHHPGDPHTISSNEVIKIYEDNQASIWIGTGSVYSNKAGDPTIGGLNHFNRNTGKFTRYLHQPGNPNSLANNKVRAIYEDSRGKFWVGTAGDGLHIMNRQKGTFQRLPYDPDHPEKLSRPPLSKNIIYGKFDHITFITEDSLGNIWIGTSESGIKYYHTNTGKTVHFMAGKDEVGNYTDRTAWTAFTSTDGVLWLSSITGNLYKVNILQRDIPFIQIPGAIVNAIYKQQNGILWVGTQNMGLFRMSPEQTILSHYFHEPGNAASLSQNWVSGFAEDKLGRVWVGTHKGLNLYNPRNNSFTCYRHETGAVNSLPADWIHELETDRKGNLWLSTSEGLVRMDGNSGTFRLFTFETGVGANNSDNGILYSKEDLSGNIWAAFVASDRGLVRLDPLSGEFKNFKIAGITNHIAVDPVDGSIWISGSNLARYDPSTGELKKFLDAVTRQPIRGTRSLIIDRQRNLWISSSAGIIQVDLTLQKIKRIFGEKYGVKGDKIAYQAAGAGTGGKLYFGSYDGGYYELLPGEIIKKLKKTELVITGFQLAGQPIQPGSHNPFKAPLADAEKIKLSHSQNVFSFQFAAIDFIDPENNHQFYKLENYDDDWNQAGPDQRAFYFKVPPGNYRFRVKAANSNRLWEEQSIAVIITPPWWWHWWVWSLAAILIVSSIYLIIRQRMLRKYKARLKRSEQEKEIAELRNKAAELEMQALRSQMNPHFIFNSLNSINRFILQNNRTQAAEYLAKFSRLMRLILQNSQASMITLNSELEALKLYLGLELLRFNNHFIYHLSIQPGLEADFVRVPPLIIQPFAENAIWHGLMHKEGKGHLDIVIEAENQQLKMKITDDGIGRQRAAELASKSSPKNKSMGLKITAGRLSLLQKTNGNASPVTVNDLVHPDGTAAGTEIIIKLPLRYD